jgi:hypothetical protein
MPPHHALHDVSLFVRLLVERLLTRLILPGRDHLLDLAAPAPASDAWVTVALVPSQAVRPAFLTRAAVQQPPSQGRFQELALVTLPRRDVDGNNEAVAVTNQMDLCAKATTRPSKRMVKWLLKLRFFAPS